MKYSKRSTVRDFRIQLDQLPTMDDDEGEAEEEEMEGEDGDQVSGHRYLFMRIHFV